MAWRPIEEITQDILAPETALKPFTRSKKNQNDLIKLREYFINYFNKEYGVDIRIGKDFYGLEIPYLHGSNISVRGIKRMQ